MPLKTFIQWNIAKNSKFYKYLGIVPPILYTLCQNCKIPTFNLICGACMLKKISHVLTL